MGFQPGVGREVWTQTQTALSAGIHAVQFPAAGRSYRAAPWVGLVLFLGRGGFFIAKLKA